MSPITEEINHIYVSHIPVLISEVTTPHGLIFDQEINPDYVYITD